MLDLIILFHFPPQSQGVLPQLPLGDLVSPDSKNWDVCGFSGPHVTSHGVVLHEQATRCHGIGSMVHH